MEHKHVKVSNGMQPHDAITDHFRLNDYQKQALKKLRLATIENLLYHFPTRHNTVADTAMRVADLKKGDKAILYGTLSKLEAKKAWRKKIPMASGVFSDDSGKLDVVWFNQPYIAKMARENSPVKLEGKVSERRATGQVDKGKLYLSNPEVEHVSALPTGAPEGMFREGEQPTIFPVYPESRGVTSRWFYHAIQKVFASGILETLQDPVPPDILKTYNLPGLQSALVWMHVPKNERHSRAARKRFAFEEVFLIQLKKQQDRQRADAEPSWKIVPRPEELKTFVSRFPFTPTKAQERAVQDILTDISTPHAMSRLLEGDVGSGKTFVAATTAHAVVATHPKNAAGKTQDFGNLQVAYMAPTEILAQQHFESFINYFQHLPIQIGLISSSGSRKFPSKVRPDTWTDISRAQLLKWVANGEIPILIGTHALIQKSVRFKHLAYVIIDEQHRFGTRQRAELARKDTDAEFPHLLSMTATPIPRTLALTIFGDLDLTLLDEMPPGRKQIITKIVSKNECDATYKKIKEELNAGRQAYVICPRIEEPDPDKANALQTKSVKAETERLQKEVFTKYAVGMLHGKMRPKEKDDVMNAFASGDIDVLVATSVLEVGVNVPNATVIVIEGPERFGLAQLHQLRGRVLRSTHQAYCYLFPGTKSKISIARLKALVEAKNGFELAEKDLEFRGAGELYGRTQWGISDIGMEAIKNIKMVEAARSEAQKLIAQDPKLKKHSLLSEKVAERGNIHFE
ncbi:ATP-dependent DNA helicase RecG [Candidatus Wolfebacteria bacterium]|nr:ATP-dependent DNA helicase RecG [Candidatus Wolfebacteria bacterium]